MGLLVSFTALHELMWKGPKEGSAPPQKNLLEVATV